MIIKSNNIKSQIQRQIQRQIQNQNPIIALTTK